MYSKIEYLEKYSQLKDELLELTEEYHDSMHFDIEGYYEDSFVDMVELENQVKAFEMLLEALKKIKYTYA
jgi:antirestriction protein